ncbi:MAG: NADH-quinone oxidoreductase subunit N [Bacteroidota bacterium]
MHHNLVLKNVIDNLTSCPQLLPEILIVITLGSILVLTILLPQYQRYWLFPVVFLGTLLAWYSKYWLGNHLVLAPAIPLFNDLLVLDPLAIFFCLLFISITLFMLLLRPHQASPTVSNAYGPAYVVLILGILLSSCLLVMALHWLTLYLGLTLLSLTSALLIGNHRTPHSAAASLKYLLYSMVTTALMLWGIAHLYGFTGTLALNSTSLSLSLPPLPTYIVLASILLCLSNLLWVSATVPYHFCIPDVYQGAPAYVVAYLSTIPKLTAIAVLLRIFRQLWPQLSPMLQEHTQQGIAVLALLTITVGNTAALRQKDLRRLMAYGSIAQGGLLLAGVAVSSSSLVGVLCYGTVYGIMGFATWIAIKQLQDITGSTYLQDCAGLGRQFPILSSSITLVVLALIGLPPTVGFSGKFLLFITLWKHIQQTGSYLFLILLVASLLGTVLSLYYYLKLPYMLFCKTSGPAIAPYHRSQRDGMLLWCLAALLLVGFFTANSWLKILNTVADSSFSEFQ